MAPFEHIAFDVEIDISIRSSGSMWPDDEDVDSESNPGCNREYMDLRGLTWADASEVFQLEESSIQCIEHSDNPPAEYARIMEDMYEDPIVDIGLMGLDLGVASTVVSLSAFGCIPISSCNGGAFGDRHYEEYPLVAFYIKREQLPIIIELAKAAGLGLYINQGAIVMYAAHIKDMMSFAQSLILKGNH